MIAEVIVDILHSNVDRIYDYELPHDGAFDVGLRVLVDFCGRSVSGIIIGIKDETDCPIDKLKPIKRVLDSKPILSREMIELMWHLKKTNHIICADSLRCFMPSEMRSNSVRERMVFFVRLEPNMDESVLKNAPMQRRVVEFLKTYSEDVERSHLSELFSPAAISGLIKRGYISLVEKQFKRVPYKGLTLCDNNNIVLTSDQVSVCDMILGGNESKYLLHGVTGSGKTEVYMKIISECLKRNKSAIMLVPEIALTPQMLKHFRMRFSDMVAILHSGLSAGERYDEWHRISCGDARIVIGARSAIFAPLKNIGVIIIDEEHEQSYVPDSGKFTTLNIAEFRREYNAAKLVIGSATPSIESYYKTVNGEYKLLELNTRINQKPMPNIEIVDMRQELRKGNNTIFSSLLKYKMEECMSNNLQAMLFINRRGFSSVVMCQECGYVAKCKDCDVTLTYHKEEDVLKCHYCGLRFKMLDICPECKGEHIRQKGLGTERVCDEIKKMFPNARVLRMDNDTTSSKEGHAKIVESFAKKQADILVGTQMITKGHDFKDVSLVGILDADLSLYFSDYRSVERTFQLITQVAGRAGRADAEGAVVLQTYSPNHYVYNVASKYNYSKFYEREISLREATNYPPFAKIVKIAFCGENEQLVINLLKIVFEQVEKLDKECFVFMPRKMKAPIKRLQKKYRYQILMRLKCENFQSVIDELYKIIGSKKQKGVMSYIEVDPNSMS